MLPKTQNILSSRLRTRHARVRQSGQFGIEVLSLATVRALTRPILVTLLLWVTWQCSNPGGYLEPVRAISVARTGFLLDGS